MVITLLLFFAVMIVVFVKNYNSKYTLNFEVTVIGLIMVVTSNLLYTAKLSTYKPYFPMEGRIFFIINSIPVHIFSIKWILIVGIALIMLSQIMIIIMTGRNVFSIGLKKYSLFILIVLFVILNSPEVGKNLYIMRYSQSEQRALFINNSILVYNYSLILSLFLSELIFLVIYYYKTRLFFVKKHMILFGSFCLCSELIFMFVFFNSPLKKIFNPLRINDFEIYYNITQQQFYIQLICIVVLITITFLLSKYRVFESERLFFKRKISKRASYFLNDIRHIFHSYKNNLFIIMTLQKKAMDCYGTKEGIEALGKIRTVSRDFFDNIGRLLDVYNTKKLTLEEINIKESVAKAADKLTCDDIEIDVLFNEDDDCMILGDNYYLVEMFYNIIKNSVESINEKSISNGKITIKIFSESKWICVEIGDNGMGINHKIRRRIFKPLYSTKRTFKNWGLGLSYAQSVTQVHGGFINVESKTNVYTKIQCVFIKEEKRQLKNEKNQSFDC